MGGDPFVDEILDRAAMGIAAGKRLAFWGFDQAAFAGLARLPNLSGAEFQLASDFEGHQNFSLYGRRYLTPAELLASSPEEILLLKRTNAQSTFHKLVELGFGPKQIFLTRSAWDDRLFVDDPLFERILASVPKSIAGGLSCDEVTLHTYQALRYVVQRRIPGDIVNFGVFQGWSMYFTAITLEMLHDPIPRSIIGFDTFEGFVPTNNDYDNFVHYQCGLGKTGWNFFKNVSPEMVKGNLARFQNVILVQGDIRATIGELANRQVALALFDMDDYAPTKASLFPTYQRMPSGSAIVFDHFSCHTLAEGSAVGQRLAMLEFLRDHPLFNLTGTNVFLV